MDEVCVATTTNPADLAIEMHVAERWSSDHMSVFRGSEKDVLGRTLAAAEARRADVIVDITSDSPCCFPEFIDLLHNKLLSDALDYCSNIWPDYTYENGCDVQIYTMDAFQRLCTLKEPAINREHSGWNFTRHSRRFRVSGISLDGAGRFDTRWTLDTPEDYRFLDAFISRLTIKYGPLFTYHQAREEAGC